MQGTGSGLAEWQGRLRCVAVRCALRGRYLNCVRHRFNHDSPFSQVRALRVDAGLQRAVTRSHSQPPALAACLGRAAAQTACSGTRPGSRPASWQRRACSWRGSQVLLLFPASTAARGVAAGARPPARGRAMTMPPVPACAEPPSSATRRALRGAGRRGEGQSHRWTEHQPLDHRLAQLARGVPTLASPATPPPRRLQSGPEGSSRDPRGP